MRKIKSQIAVLEKPKRKKNRTACEASQLKALYQQLEILRVSGDAQDKPTEEDDINNLGDEIAVAEKKSFQKWTSSQAVGNGNFGQTRKRKDVNDASHQLAKKSKITPQPPLRYNQNAPSKIQSDFDGHHDLIGMRIPSPITDPYAYNPQNERFSDIDIAFLLEVTQGLAE
jgi:hypothetical protein